MEEERIRIARDVHDGVAHALASISIQAGAGGAVFDSDPREPARLSKPSVRRALRPFPNSAPRWDVLRHQAMGPWSEDSTPNRSTGWPTFLGPKGSGCRSRGGSSQPVEGEVGTAIHRILQEALTNVLRHSARRKVDIIARSRRRRSRACGDRRRQRARQGTGSQPGLRPAGHARAGGLGRRLGRVRARSGGGFSVKAVLPVKGRS